MCVLSLFGKRHSGSQLALPSSVHSVQRLTHRPLLMRDTGCRRWFCHALQCAKDDTCPDVLTRNLAGHGRDGGQNLYQVVQSCYRLSRYTLWMALSAMAFLQVGHFFCAFTAALMHGSQKTCLHSHESTSGTSPVCNALQAASHYSCIWWPSAALSRNAGQQLTRRARRPLLSCSPYTLDTAARMVQLMAAVHQHAAGWQACSACASLAALCLQVHPLENAM